MTVWPAQQEGVYGGRGKRPEFNYKQLGGFPGSETRGEIKSLTPTSDQHQILARSSVHILNEGEHERLYPTEIISPNFV
jgi:hypothetical protein